MPSTSEEQEEEASTSSAASEDPVVNPARPSDSQAVVAAQAQGFVEGPSAMGARLMTARDDVATLATPTQGELKEVREATPSQPQSEVEDMEAQPSPVAALELQLINELPHVSTDPQLSIYESERVRLPSCEYVDEVDGKFHVRPV